MAIFKKKLETEIVEFRKPFKEMHQFMTGDPHGSSRTIGIDGERTQVKLTNAKNESLIVEMEVIPQEYTVYQDGYSHPICSPMKGSGCFYFKIKKDGKDGDIIYRQDGYTQQQNAINAFKEYLDKENNGALNTKLIKTAVKAVLKEQEKREEIKARAQKSADKLAAKAKKQEEKNKKNEDIVQNRAAKDFYAANESTITKKLKQLLGRNK